MEVMDIHNAGEDSSDESERGDDDYQGIVHRYDSLIKRALRHLGPDLESHLEDTNGSSPSPARGVPNGAGHRQQQMCAALSGAAGPAAQPPAPRSRPNL